MNQKHTLLWGSAFTAVPENGVLAFCSGRDVAVVPAADTALVPYDILVNKAHAVMLAKCGIIPAVDAAAILHGLSKLEHLAATGKFTLKPENEDVHTNIEAWLTEDIGSESAGKLHTARSRNDQVVTDMALYLNDMARQMALNTIRLNETLLVLSAHHKNTVVPGFTHHQHAMVTTFGHLLAAYASMMLRDAERFRQWIGLHDSCPLGNSAAYGTSHPINRKLTAHLLGFAIPDDNSLDAITNRAESATDLVFAVSQLMNHCSSLAEMLILFSMPEFGMVTVSDTYSTGSSVMPQKKNPDPLETVKAKTAAVHGILSGLLSSSKNAFPGFNKDSQWSKYMAMDAVTECTDVPLILSGLLQSLTVHADVMKSWCNKGYIGTAMLMEHLTSQFGLPMRMAKIAVETAVKYSEGGQTVSHAALMQAFSDLEITVPITVDQVAYWQSPEGSIALLKSYGSAGKNSMKSALKHLRKKLSQQTAWLRFQQNKKETVRSELDQEIRKILNTAKGGEQS